MPTTVYLPQYRNRLSEGFTPKIVSCGGQPAIHLGNGRYIVLNSKDVFGNPYRIGQTVEISLEPHPQSREAIDKTVINFFRDPRVIKK
jgi:hypothetical protein